MRLQELVSTDDLRQWLGLDRPSAIRARLNAWGILWRDGPEGPVTTLRAIEEAFSEEREEVNDL